MDKNQISFNVDNRKNCGNKRSTIVGSNNTVTQTDNDQKSVNEKAKDMIVVDNRENSGNFDNSIKGDRNSVTQQSNNQNPVNPNFGNKDIERENENNSTEEIDLT